MSTHPYAARRTVPPAALAVGALAASTACLLLVLAAAVVFVRPSVTREPNETTATVGGLHYSVNNAWVLDPGRSVDAPLAKGLPAADTKAAARQLLYAVFVGVTNDTNRRLPMATDIALRDTRNREFAPIPVGAQNAFAYRPGVMAPRTHRPAPSTAPARDLATAGMMLVFRIPQRSYNDGPLQLVVHDPSHPGTARTMQT